MRDPQFEQNRALAETAAPHSGHGIAPPEDLHLIPKRANRRIAGKLFNKKT
jgi:hypothetical protein